MLPRCSLSFVVVLALFMGGCVTGGPGPALVNLPPEAAVECPPAGLARGNAPLRLALPGEIRPSRAPLPATEAERHVFASLYEPLVRLDCEGRLQPALAASWSASDGGRVWTFRLRRDARFWTGEAVTAEAVAASWRRAEALCRLRGEPSPLLDLGEFGAVAPDEFVVRLRSRSDQLPLRVVHPALAVVGPSDGRGWLAGSGPCRPDEQGTGLLPVAGHPLQPRWPRLELVIHTVDSDPRDALDLGADALVTRSRTVHDYYAGRRGLVVAALPWDRWYYLVTPEADPRWASSWDRRELADEVGDQVASPADFSAYSPPPDGLSLSPVVTILRAPALSLTEDLIIWPADDIEAGQLADRLATLAARPLRSEQTNVGAGALTPPSVRQPAALAVDPVNLTTYVQEARAGAVILPWPRRCPRPRDELYRLLSLATWLQEAAQNEELDDGAVPPGTRPARFLDATAPSATLAATRRLERGKVVQPLVRSRAILVSEPSVRGWSWDLLGRLQLWAMARQD